MVNIFKRSKKYIILLFLALTTLLGTIGTAAFVFLSYGSAHPNYDVHVAYNENTKLYYPTVETALNDANSGETVIILKGKNPTIYKDTIVKTGVTLALELDSTGKSHIGDQEHGIGQSKDYKISKIDTNLNINDGVTLYNYGTIFLRGYLGGGNGTAFAAGNTIENSTSITLKRNARIICGSQDRTKFGKMVCLGFIYEETLNNLSQVICYNGEIRMPFVVRDFRGGSHTVAAYCGSINSTNNKNIAPFNQFVFENISPKLTIHYYGSLVALCNLYANDECHSTSNIVIGKGLSLIQMTNQNSYVEAKFNPINEKCDLKIYGGANMNSFNLSVTLKDVVKVNVTTGSVYFPVNWRYSISLLNSPANTQGSVFNIDYKIKFLPGSKLVIGENTTLNVNGEMVFSDYEDLVSGSKVANTFNDSQYTCAGDKYIKADFRDFDEDGNKTELNPFAISDAYCDIYGTLNSNGSLGGKLYSKSIDAQLFIGGQPSSTYKELMSVADEKFLLVATTNTKATYDSITHNSVGYVDNNNPETSLGQFGYISMPRGSNEYYWEKLLGNYTISYEIVENGVLANNPVCSLPTTGLPTSSSYESGAITLPDGIVPSSSRFVFMGWSYNIENTAELINNKLTGGFAYKNAIDGHVTIYAIFEEVDPVEIIFEDYENTTEYLTFVLSNVYPGKSFTLPDLVESKKVDDNYQLVEGRDDVRTYDVFDKWYLVAEDDEGNSYNLGENSAGASIKLDKNIQKLYISSVKKQNKQYLVKIEQTPSTNAKNKGISTIKINGTALSTTDITKASIWVDQGCEFEIQFVSGKGNKTTTYNVVNADTGSSLCSGNITGGSFFVSWANTTDLDPISSSLNFPLIIYVTATWS